MASSLVSFKNLSLKQDYLNIYLHDLELLIFQFFNRLVISFGIYFSVEWEVKM